jgi:exonuclease SbcC
VKPHRLVLAGFGAFAKRAEIDFDRLSEFGLYLIIGETGSGKTTIFDAMTYALYGEVAGNRDKQSVASDYEHRDEPYVEFHFSHKNRHFIIKREVEGRTPSDHSITEVDSSGAQISAVTGKSNIQRYVEELIGLDADQFMKVVLLPQGKFQDFLVANSSEREKLLQVLFGTAVYQKISDSLVERARLKVDEATTALQKLKMSEITAQEIIDGLPKDDDLGEIPRLELGYDDTLSALKSQKAISDKSSQTLGAALTAAAKKSQAVGDEAELFDAKEELDELVLIHNSASKVTASAIDAIEKHEKAIPVSNAHKSEQASHSAKKQAEGELQQLDKNLTEIIRVNKSEKLIAEVKEIRTNGAASVNAYIAKTKALIQKAQSKFEDVANLTVDAEEARELIDESNDRELEIKDELKELVPQQKKLAAEQKKQQQAIAKLSDLKSRSAEIEKLLEVADVVGAKAELKAADTEYKSASKVYETAESSLKDANNLRTKHLAGELGATLKSGKECPVCGSTDHPLKAKRSKVIDIELLESKRTKAQTRFGEAEAELKRCQTQLTKATAAAGKLPTKEVQTKLQTDLKVATQASKDLEKTSKLITTLAKSISQLETESSGLKTEIKNQTKTETNALTKSKALSAEASAIISEDSIESALDALDEISTLIKKLETAERKVDSASSRAEESAANVQKVLKVSGFATVAAALKAVCEQAALMEFKQAIKDSESRTTQITRLEGRIKGKTIPKTRPDTDTAEKNLTAATQLAKVASELANALGTAVSVVESLVKNQQTIGANALENLEFAKTAKSLADKFRNGTLGANGVLGLERWVQRHLFREVCNVGNTHIRSLSKGRYELTLDPQDGRERARAGGLDLYVIDANSGKTRQVQNLSGGETFLVSLALALSLAEVVQSLFGGIELSSLFIDEGFGTLDSDTLDSAVSLLDSIQSDGRSIGIITHVDQMQKTLPIGMKIHKTPRGSSIEQMDHLAIIG